MATRFVRFELRTTDEPAARAFYEEILEDGCPDISPLPEPARARGLPPQWLGHVAVPDVPAALDAWVARGAILRGPPPSGASPRAVIRDPGGAMLALSAAANAPRRADVLWHQLVTEDLETAAKNYAELFGWSLEGSVEAEGFGPVRALAFAPGDRIAGGMASVEGRSGVHTQWLHFFRTTQLDATIERIRSKKGLALAPFRLSTGARCVACDDPQGGAFGLIEPPS